jgi:hypothetical protein
MRRDYRYGGRCARLAAGFSRLAIGHIDIRLQFVRL